MHPDIVSFGSVTLHGYGLMIAIGIVMAYFSLKYRAKSTDLNGGVLLSLFLWLILGGMLGAKLFYLLTLTGPFIDNMRILFDLTQGYVVYGGIIGGLVTACLFCKIKQINLLDCLDLLAPSVVLAQGFGRIGCFFAGCCWGIETNSWFGVVFPEGGAAPGGIRVMPTQLMSSFFDFALFFILIIVAKKTEKKGIIVALYLILYSVGRFIIEYFRGDMIRGSVGVLSTSQLIALFVFVAGCLFYRMAASQKTK